MSADKPIYSLTEIRTKNVVGIQQRNAIKSGYLDKILSVKAVWNIPYQAYYMSCNLEHVLHNEMNLTDSEKEKLAFEFAKKYSENLPGFVEYISCSSFCVPGDYLQTWQYVRDGLHSLERHTNLGICLKLAQSL